MYATGLALGALFLWLALRNADLTKAQSLLLHEVDYRLAALLVVVCALYLWCKAFRWQLLLVPIRRVGVRLLLPPVVIGYAVNVLVPAQVGEMARAILGRRIFGIKAVCLLASIVLERVLDALVILMMLGIALLLGSAGSRYLMTAGYALSTIAVLTLIATCFYLYRTDSAIAFIARLTVLLPQRWRVSIDNHLAQGALGFEALRRPRLLVNVIVVSVIMWSMMAGSIHLCAATLGLAIPWSAAVVTLVLLAAGMTLPTSPGLVGTAQICFVLGLKPYGIGAGDAVAASVIYQACVVAPAVLGGGFYAWRSRLLRAPSVTARKTVQISRETEKNG